MARKVLLRAAALSVTAAGLILSGCSLHKMDPEKIRDIEYTVVDKEEVPEEFLDRIEEEKKEPFRMSWKEQGYLYAARGYGEQKTSGYSIEVTGCYEAKQGIYIEISLMGQDKGEEISEAPAYPYVVVKMEYIDKEVIFR